ncbi:LysM peptidoglycan-binding domain-containing protein [Paenibacillus crassostreae]|uniref:LysM domain-containing protein n=1 Tax=Paenibacillus crassostreae TaxID=1763538 RepID=A0A167DS36_9BACL|nr:LysM peptidoglycan-binding domain-containing protein [Paenibacillus crassostreae]AOZ91123.1 hypothetical protein LPB68_02145 [Paenibacillus crassostreae]OAB74717.1 hypothetical protein PNBC_11810 [Paenibacillus crassostreae]
MLRYSTYESIYVNTNEENKHTQIDRWSEQVKSMIPRPLIKKLLWVILLLSVACTGMVQTFANSAGDVKVARNLIVQSGDSLWEIALREKPANMDTRIYIKEVKRMNQLSSGNIMAGEVLSLPTY